MKDASHIVMLLIVLVAIGAGFFAVRTVMVPEGFGAHGSYSYGYFRAASEKEQAARDPVYRGPEKCRECHAEVFAAWKAAEHAAVGCETCHGNWQAHNANTTERAGADTGIQACMICHARVAGRPAGFPQIQGIREHVADKGGEIQEKQTCTACHNPHDPA